VSHRQARPGEGGYVLLAVLLLAVLITSVTMAHARHALMAATDTNATLKSQVAEHAAGSGFAWAKQSLLADGARSTLLQVGSDDIGISVTDDGPDLHSVTVTASGEGYSQEVSGIVETYRTTAGQLPGLTSSAVTALMGASGRVEVSGSVTYADTEITGILYLRHGATLTLRHVILSGSIVSEAACSDAAWTPAQQTTIIVDGGLLIEPGATLPGCAIVAPDAAVTGTGNDRVQIRGVVVARNVTLPGSGALHKQVVASEPLALSALVDQPGSGRAPRTWPDALDTGAEGVSRVAFPNVTASADEQESIEDFAFPRTP